MWNPEKTFLRIHDDANHAESFYNQNNLDAVHYFLGRVSGSIRIIRDELREEKREPDEPIEKKE